MQISAGVACEPQPIAAKRIPQDQVARDVDAILQGFELRRLRRYSWQAYFRLDSLLSGLGDRVALGRRLENVAEHSWHVADATLILSGHFVEVDPMRSCALAAIHDKLELFTGDWSPINSHGTSEGTHFGDASVRARKQMAEAIAMGDYLQRLSRAARPAAESLLSELAACETPTSRFVRAVDKLQALAFVVATKRNQMPEKHRQFTMAYSGQVVELFPPLESHLAELRRRISPRL